MPDACRRMALPSSPATAAGWSAPCACGMSRPAAARPCSSARSRVDRTLQGKGVGAGLMQVALARAADAGHGAVILVGDPEYYERFGFAADPAAGLVMPGPVERRRFLGLELARGALDGAEGAVVATGAWPPPRGSPHRTPHAVTGTRR